MESFGYYNDPGYLVFTKNKVIEPSRYQNKPISVRNPYIFYLGHLPVFLDIQLAKALNSSTIGSDYYTTIFERGIDPNLDDVTICHSHSPTPSEWPMASEILTYRDTVRKKAQSYFEAAETSPELARAFNMCYEHEAMHIEVYVNVTPDSPLHVPSRQTEPTLRLSKAHSAFLQKHSIVVGRMDRNARRSAENGHGSGRTSVRLGQRNAIHESHSRPLPNAPPSHCNSRIPRLSHFLTNPSRPHPWFVDPDR